MGTTTLLKLILICAILSFCGVVLSNKTIGHSVEKTTFKCFVCFWAQNDERCGDSNFTINPGEPGKYMVNCLACYKQTYYASKGNKVKVLRGCAQELPHYSLKCQYIFNEDNSYMETCACASQYCNQASNNRIPYLALFVVIVGWTLVKTGLWGFQ